MFEGQSAQVWPSSTKTTERKHRNAVGLLRKPPFVYRFRDAEYASTCKDYSVISISVVTPIPDSVWEIYYYYIATLLHTLPRLPSTCRGLACGNASLIKRVDTFFLANDLSWFTDSKQWLCLQLAQPFSTVVC